MSKLVQRAVNAIIRPPRSTYEEKSFPQSLQGDDGIIYMRHPLGFINDRNIIIVGSYYYGPGMDPVKGGPCVLYLHGNSSSQFEGQFLVPNLCKHGIFVCCFDFAGCGCSGGDYVSLGYFEKQDTEFLIGQLHKFFSLGPFILWGRSMGAATALLVDSPLVVGRVSDSSFTSVPELCSAIATTMKLPSIFVPAAVWFLKKQVVRRANFDINEVAPIAVKRANEVPALFGHAKKDKFIPFEQCKRLFESYRCAEKRLVELDGEHNSKRKTAWIREGVEFVLKYFNIRAKKLQISSCRKLQESIYHFSSFQAMVNETERTHIVDSDLEDDYMNEFLEEENKNEKENENKEESKDESDSGESESDNNNGGGGGGQQMQFDVMKNYADFICNGE